MGSCWHGKPYRQRPVRLLFSCALTKEFEHFFRLTSEKLWYKDVQSLSGRNRARKLLPEKYRRLFANKQIVCVEYQDITDSDEREIFQVTHTSYFLLRCIPDGVCYRECNWAWPLLPQVNSTISRNELLLTLFCRKTSSHQYTSRCVHPWASGNLPQRGERPCRWCSRMGQRSRKWFPLSCTIGVLHAEIWTHDEKCRLHSTAGEMAQRNRRI